jgi:hypothetical protein
MENQDFEISKNISAVEYLKTRMVTIIATIFQLLQRGNEKLLDKTLARLIIYSYLLGKRLGINPAKLDIKIEGELNREIQRGNQLERDFQDYSFLLQYFKRTKGL